MRPLVCRALLVLSAAALLGQPPVSLSPAQQAIAQAREAIAKNPGEHELLNALAMALARRARETGDTANYDEGLAAIAKSLKLAPDNFEALRTRVWLLLGKHEFAEALKQVKELHKRSKDDHMVYGLMADAQIELGQYKEAEETVQWMLDLSRGGIPALTRAAYLRELFGDIEGAVELMESAYRRVRPEQTEDRAWILTQMAHLRLAAGKTADAGLLLDEALRTFDGYHYALANLAKVRAAEGKHSEAVELLRRRYEAAPHPENLYELAVALEWTGEEAEARKAFAEFEQKARAEMNSWDNANRELVFYYADHAGMPAEALQVARLEVARRRDVYTVDAYAWALHVNGRHSEAQKEIEAALAVGTRDPRVLKHAGEISPKLRHRGRS